MSDQAEGRTAPKEAVSHLMEADPVMANLIMKVGALEYRIQPDLWQSMVGAIVGQQLSTSAARTIRGRVEQLGGSGFPTPGEMLEMDEETLRGCGLSRAKLSYVRDLAGRFHDGQIDPERIATLGDEEVIEELTQVKGIGRWTAEMVLLFSLGRPDVLAVDDLGIRNAVQRAYGLDDRPDRRTLQIIGASWSPWRSFASLYLWRSLALPN